MKRALEMLREIAGMKKRHVPQPHSGDREIIDCGFRINENTGAILGPHFVAHHNLNSWDGEMFQYARENRFRLLFREFAIPLCRRADVLKTFLELEAAWEERKSRYDRIYFISQKMTCIYICTRLGIPHTVGRFPIRDKKRLRKQRDIFEDLWANRKTHTTKHERTIIDHLGGSRQATPCPSEAGNGASETD